MRHRVIVALVVLGAARSARAADPSEPAAVRKEAWQRYLDGRTFSPPNAGDGALYSLSQYHGDCKVRMTYDPDRRSAPSFVFERAGRDLVKLDGRPESVFRTEANVLYFAAFPTATTGCTVLAYDLTTGKKRWETELKAVGRVSHRGYWNRVNLHVGRWDQVDSEGEGNVEVVGRESYGDYIEVLDRRTGTLLAHKVYRQGFAPAK